MLKMAIITGFLSQTKDRFHEYNAPLNLDQKFELMAHTEGYDGYFTSDTSPTRWDIKGTFEANSRITNRIWNLLDEVDHGQLAKLMAGNDYLETWKFIEDNILGLK